MTPSGARYSGVLLYSEAVDFTRQVERYLQVFDRRQVHVVLMDDMVGDPVAVMEHVQRFLEVEVVGGLALLHRNENRTPRSVRLHQLVKHRTSWVFESRVSCVVPAGPCSDLRSAFGWLAEPSAMSVKMNMARRARPPLPSGLRAELTRTIRAGGRAVGAAARSRPFRMDDGCNPCELKHTRRWNREHPSSLPPCVDERRCDAGPSARDAADLDRSSPRLGVPVLGAPREPDVAQDRSLFDRAETYAQKADIARYEVVHRFGGVYVDTDMECLRPAGRPSQRLQLLRRASTRRCREHRHLRRRRLPPDPWRRHPQGAGLVLRSSERAGCRSRPDPTC